jgi:hypothetical protein
MRQLKKAALISDSAGGFLPVSLGHSLSTELFRNQSASVGHSAADNHTQISREARLAHFLSQNR